MVYFAPPPRHPPCSLCLVILLLIYCFMLLASSLLFYFCWLAVIDLLHLFLIVPCCVAFHTLVSSIFKALVCVFSLLCCTVLLPTSCPVCPLWLLDFCYSAPRNLFLISILTSFSLINGWSLVVWMLPCVLHSGCSFLTLHHMTEQHDQTMNPADSVCGDLWGVFTSSCWALCTMVFCACVCAELGKIVHFCQPKFFSCNYLILRGNLVQLTILLPHHPIYFSSQLKQDSSVSPPFFHLKLWWCGWAS